MTPTLIPDNAVIFPDPNSFKPERWLPLDTEGKRLQKFLVSFSKGSRQCLGKSLAYAELYMAFAAIFGEFGSKTRLVDTVGEGCRCVAWHVYRIPGLGVEGYHSEDRVVRDAYPRMSQGHDELI